MLRTYLLLLERDVAGDEHEYRRGDRCNSPRRKPRCNCASSGDGDPTDKRPLRFVVF
jgi:hypothetical protein